MTDLHETLTATRSQLIRRPQSSAGGARRTSLLFVEQREVRFVPSVLHLVDGNEMKGGGVNDVTLAGGRLRVGKDMAKAGITSLGAHLGPLHLVCVVGHLDEEIFRNGFRERGQTDVAVELVD